MVLRWLCVVVLLALGLWFGNLALFNWWAAGGPPSPHAQTYAFRGNVFGALAAFFVLAVIVLVVVSIRRSKE